MWWAPTSMRRNHVFSKQHGQRKLSLQNHIVWLYYKKRHIRDILGRTNFFLSYIWHFYDDNCDKTQYHHRCGGILLLRQKSWQKMGFSSWAGRRHSCMTFFGPSMTKKTMVEARARKILGSSRLRWVVGGRAMRVSLIHVRACVWGVGQIGRASCRERV